MHRDFIEFIDELNGNGVEFVIIDGIALAFYGHPRFTGDLDIWIRPDIANTEKTFRAIEHFFGTYIGTSPGDFLTGHRMITLGEEPVRIEIHTALDGVTEGEIWDGKVRGTFGDRTVYYIGKETFIKNKRTVGRMQDLADIEKITG